MCAEEWHACGMGTCGRDFDDLESAMDLGGGNNYPGQVPRDIGADEHQTLFARVIFGNVGDQAYTVVDATPGDVFDGVLDDPDDPNDSPDQNPAITLQIGRRYEFHVLNATEHPIALAALHPTDPAQDELLFVMDKHFIENVGGNLRTNSTPNSGVLEGNSNWNTVGWREDGHDADEDQLPPEGTPIGGRVSFVLTPELAAEMAEGNLEAGYRCYIDGAMIRGTILVVDPGPIDQTAGFYLWWENFP